MADQPTKPAAGSTTTSPATRPAVRAPRPASLRVDYEEPVIRRRPNRVVAWFRGWADENLSREKVGSGLRTMLWVAPLTALIWIYAERQQLQTAENVTLPISVVSGDPTKVARVVPPSDENVIVRLRGPKAVLEDAIKKFNPLAGNRPAEIVLDRTIGTGEQTVPAVRIREDKRLAEAGIIVEDVRPEGIRVYVDQIVAKDYPVQVADLQRFGTPPVFDPPVVKVSGPERVLGNPANPLRLVADVATQLNGRPPSDQPVVLKSVKLTLVGADEKLITLSPPTVVAKVMPVAPKEIELRTVLLYPGVTNLIMNSYQFDLPDTLSNVKVSGPADVIEKLEASQEVPVAYARIPQSVITAGHGEVPIEFQLPPGVVVHKDVRKSIPVTVRPRTP